jgi:chemotaxis protein CheX
MNIKNLDLFIKAAEEIFKEIGFTGLIIQDGSRNEEKYDLIANIGITGDISGFLLIRSDLGSSMNFINKMLSNMGMEAEESDFGKFHKEAFGEILNQISGRSTMLLEASGINCEITPPTILMGTKISMGTYVPAEIVHKTISGGFGSFDLLIGAKE